MTSTRKRTIKRLMALGVQRNDAAGFIAARNAIKAAHMEHLLPWAFMPPAPPIHTTNRRLEKFATSIYLHPEQVLSANIDDEYIHRDLARSLAQGILAAGFIKITKRQLPPEAWTRGPCVEYRATITVVEEE